MRLEINEEGQKRRGERKMIWDLEDLELKTEQRTIYDFKRMSGTFFLSTSAFFSQLIPRE